MNALGNVRYKVDSALRMGLCAGLFIALAVGAFGDCCGLVCGSIFGGSCGDCTASSTCCGYGPCNIFCCNCDGGCRSGRCNPVGDPSSVAEDYFRSIDRDGDWAVSKPEFRQWLDASGKRLDEGAAQKAFHDVDKNADGVIGPGEFDSGLDPAGSGPRMKTTDPIVTLKLTTEEKGKAADYWTEERLRKAAPKTMPTLTEEEFQRLMKQEGPKSRLDRGWRVFSGDAKADGGVEAGEVGAQGKIEGANVHERPFWNGGKLFFTAPDGDMICSAEFVGSKRVLMTAAHCVMDGKTGKWYKNFSFRRAYDGGGGQNVGIHCLALYKGWYEGGGPHYAKDYAFIYTSDDSGAGWLGFWSDLPYAAWWSIGYPMNYKCSENMAKVEGGKGSVSGGIVRMNDNPMAPGCSGGAWIGDLTTPHVSGNYAIGLNSFYYGSEPKNMYGPYFETDTYNLLQYVMDGKCCNGCDAAAKP